LSKEKAKTSIRQLLAIFEVAAVTRAVIESALDQNLIDFEDAVLHESGRQHTVDVIVTRNVVDFRQALVPIYTPAEFSAVLSTLDLGSQA
jgi:hypothetical protein